MENDFNKSQGSVILTTYIGFKANQLIAALTSSYANRSVTIVCLYIDFIYRESLFSIFYNANLP